jgi:ABC-type sugar transport system ATPase subunit
MTPLLEVREAVKSYGAVNALDGASLAVGEGEVVALLGDNGAGKSTLIKAISGVHALDAGAIAFRGRDVAFRTPLEARAAGIETLHQDLGLFDNLSAVANFRIGRELRGPRWLGRLALLRERAMEDDWHAQLERLAVERLGPRQEVGLMSGGQRQAVAVLRAVAFASALVILDEPTAALGVRESAKVLELVRRLPERGVAVLLISHNLEHVTQVADRAVVLRQGRTVGEAAPTAANHEALVSMIVGALPPSAAGSTGGGF